ncbi:MAG: phenylalanine 4-monooxygenase [Bacteroidetes bacterium]|nr:phenylalanine 4-monooxygenase [Bacteroidota bacterium]
MEQEYNNYTAEDHKVWSILFSRQMEALSLNAAKEFIEGVTKVNFQKDSIPDFNEINEKLSELTGWRLEPVKGIIPEKEFFELLSQKRFCATTWIRKMEELDYLEEPDMFHDVFGHIPLLSNPDFCSFLEGLSEIAKQHLNDPFALSLLGRVYWFTVEFGLLNENGTLKIYGAGIASSMGESKHSLSDKTEKLPFKISEILRTVYRNDVMQDKYFVICSLEELYQSLPQLKKELVNLIKEQAV